MKLIFRVSLVVFLIVGCERRLTPDVRLLVKGNVIDESENSLEGARVSVYTERGTGNFFSGLSGSEEFLMGRNFSDVNGDFLVISLFDKDEDFLIEISSAEEFTKYYYKTNTEDFIPVNYSIEFPSVKLPRKASFTYNIIRSSPLGTELQFSFEYQDDYCVEVYIEGELNEMESSCYETRYLSSTLNDNLPETSKVFSTIMGSEVVFTYSINNQPEISQTLIIDESNYESNFTY